MNDESDDLTFDRLLQWLINLARWIVARHNCGEKSQPSTFLRNLQQFSERRVANKRAKIVERRKLKAEREWAETTSKQTYLSDPDFPLEQRVVGLLKASPFALTVADIATIVGSEEVVAWEVLTGL